MNLCKIEIGVDPAFVNFCIFCKAKRDVTEANHDVTESFGFDFKAHVIMKWFVVFLINEFHILL